VVDYFNPSVEVSGRPIASLVTKNLSKPAVKVVAEQSIGLATGASNLSLGIAPGGIA